MIPVLNYLMDYVQRKRKIRIKCSCAVALRKIKFYCIAMSLNNSSGCCRATFLSHVKAYDENLPLLYYCYDF